MALLEIKNLFFNYPKTSYSGLKKISIALDLGKSLVLMGESGCGKSTLLQCLAGMHDLVNGEIYIDGKKHLGPAFHLVPNYNQVKLVNQQTDVMEFHTCIENIKNRLQGLDESYKTTRTNFLIRYFDLKHVQHEKASNLSAGQRQRLSIARSLAQLPKLLLLDEPFSNLDHALKIKALEFINKEKNKNKLSYILVTHQREDAMNNADYIAFMKDGKIIQKDIPSTCYFKPKNLYCAELLGEYNYIKNVTIDSYQISKTAFFRPNEYEKINHLLKDKSWKIKEEKFNGFVYVKKYSKENEELISFA